MNTNKYIVSNLKFLLNLLESMSDNEYSRPLSSLHGSSVGQHARHIVEFVECLIQVQPNTILSYDDRKRDVSLENSKHLISDKIQSLIAFIGSEKENFNFEIKYFLGEDEYTIMQTNYFREKLFVLDHTIHHLAIIKIGINSSFPDIYLPNEFGFTASTIRANVSKAIAE